MHGRQAGLAGDRGPCLRPLPVSSGLVRGSYGAGRPYARRLGRRRIIQTSGPGTAAFMRPVVRLIFRLNPALNCRLVGLCLGRRRDPWASTESVPEAIFHRDCCAEGAPTCGTLTADAIFSELEEINYRPVERRSSGQTRCVSKMPIQRKPTAEGGGRIFRLLIAFLLFVFLLTVELTEDL